MTDVMSLCTPRRGRSRSSSIATPANPPGSEFFIARPQKRSAEFEDVFGEIPGLPAPQELFSTGTAEASLPITKIRASWSPGAGLRRSVSTGAQYSDSKSLRCALATESFSGGETSQSTSSGSESLQRAITPKERKSRRLSLSGRIRSPRRLETIYEDESYSLVVYFKDFLGISPPIILAIPDADISESMRQCFNQAHECSWVIEEEDGIVNRCLKREAIYLLDKDIITSRHWKEEEPVKRHLIKDKLGRPMQQGQLTDMYRQEPGKSKVDKGVISRYYVFRCLF